MNNFTRSLRIGICAGLGLFFAEAAHAQVTWTGASSINYSFPGNWLGSAVPTATDNVLIPVTVRQPTVMGVGRGLNVTVNSGATLTVMANGILNVSGDLTNAGTIADQAGGIINLAGRLNNNASFGGAGELATVGTAPQVLDGTGGLINLGNLTVGAAGASLQSPMNLTRRLQLLGTLGTTLGNTLTLISTPSETAFVVNNGGTVVGNVTVQRAIDNSVNPGLGYRHYSSPVANSTVADLTVPGFFIPEISQGAAYNASTFPQATTPFPTVFNYDQGRVANPAITYVGGGAGSASATPALDKGFRVPVAGDGVFGLSLEVGRGYAVNISGSALVDFVGTLNNGSYTRTLTRNFPVSLEYASSGYHLLGNPYPAPLDFSALSPPTNPVGNPPLPNTNLVGVDATIAVVSSTSQYGNTYRYYNSNTNAVNPTLPVGQGFFIRVSNNVTSGSITFNNDQRLTSSDLTTFQRPNAITHPQVELSLTNGATPSMNDLAIVYFQNGATSGMDARYDGVKLSNSTGLNLSTMAASGEVLAIDGRPMPTGTLTIPLQVYVPTTGTYTLAAANLRNMNGMYTYLRDLQTGTMTNLSQQASYSFNQVATNFTPRFELVLSAQVLATAPASLTQQVSVYPNPARNLVSVELPATLGRQALTATLVDAMGRAVRTSALPAQGAATHNISLNGLAAGVYSLQMRTDAGLVVKRLVIE